MGKKTPLYQEHIKAHALMVDFAGWEMPLHYGSQVKEHHYVRTDAGLFDVSHMTILDGRGTEIGPFLRLLLANNIDRLVPGKALYTCMLNDSGGIIDDLIVYKIQDNFYRLIVNSATKEKDIQWIESHAKGWDLTLTHRTDLCMLALQGPSACKKISVLFNESEAKQIHDLKPFHATSIGPYFIARTGYTGEDGFEIILPAVTAGQCFETLLANGVKPCGLGARDTLRLEAGLNLYGSDMNEKTTPLESNLAWTVAFDPADRDFIGRKALEKQKSEGVQQRLVGLILAAPGVLRNHQTVQLEGNSVGEITSGSFSPTLNKGIALARVPANIGETCTVEIRGKQVSAQIVKPPFVRHDKKNILETTKVQ